MSKNIIQKLQYRITRDKKNAEYRRRLTNKDFTIISQNCLGGVIYSQLGMEFFSPTINMFIEDESFIKLAYNPKKYFSIDPVAITDKYVEPLDPSVSYPKIGIDDIEICCLHYKDCVDAIDAWNRRRKRVNLDNVFVIGNSWNMHSDQQLVEKIADAPYKTIVFSTIDIPRDNVIVKSKFVCKLPSGISVDNYAARRAACSSAIRCR